MRKVVSKNPLFSKKKHRFPTCALFYPIVLKQKIITEVDDDVDVDDDDEDVVDDDEEEEEVEDDPDLY